MKLPIPIPSPIRCLLPFVLSLQLATHAAAFSDITASIPHPPTSDIADDSKAKGRLTIHRTSKVPRAGILVKIDGFGAAPPVIENSRTPTATTRISCGREKNEDRNYLALGLSGSQ